MKKTARLSDLIECVRADEMHHSKVNPSMQMEKHP